MNWTRIKHSNLSTSLSLSIRFAFDFSLTVVLWIMYDYNVNKNKIHCDSCGTSIFIVWVNIYFNLLWRFRHTAKAIATAKVTATATVDPRYNDTITTSYTFFHRIERSLEKFASLLRQRIHIRFTNVSVSFDRLNSKWNLSRFRSNAWETAETK